MSASVTSPGLDSGAAGRVGAGTTIEAARGALVRSRQVVHRRWQLMVIALVVLVAGAFAARVLLGDFTVTVPDFVRIVSGQDVPGATYIVMESKLPRAVVGVLAGLALGASGATFQAMARNPLASPDVLGITLGASAAAVFTLVILNGSGSAVAAAAFVGGAAAAAVIMLMSGSRPGGAPYRMILTGVALAAMLSSVIQWVMLRADIYSAREAMVWLTGSLTSVTWPEITRLAVIVAVALPALLIVGRRLRLVELGDELAHGLGAPPTAVRLRAVALVVVLCASATSVCGPIAFVGFLSGPIARRLNRGRTTLFGAALVGALIVVVADYLAAYAIPTTNFPAGVITGLAGAPFLIWLMISQRAKETG